jgi:hypothetical protein
VIGGTLGVPLVRSPSGLQMGNVSLSLMVSNLQQTGLRVDIMPNHSVCDYNRCGERFQEFD